MKILILVILLLFPFWKSEAATPTQTATFKISFTDNSPSTIVVPPGQSVNDAETGFELWRCKAGGTSKSCTPSTQGALIKTLPASPGTGLTVETEDNIPGDTGGSIYCYAVNAFNSIGKSPFTPSVCGTSSTIIIVQIPITPGGPIVTFLKALIDALTP